ncbi:MAG TPA: ComEC/Rec2 family competence protein [Anaerolineae bacterium]
MRLIYFMVAWVCGILLGSWLWQMGLIGCATPVWPGLVLAGGGVLGLGALHRRGLAVGGAVLVWLLLLGAWRFQLQPLAACAGPGDVAFYRGDEGKGPWVSVEGWVSAYPDVRDRAAYYRLRAEHLTIAGQTRLVSGDVLVAAPRWPVWRYGDRLAVAGALEAPPKLVGFDYPGYLAQKGIFSRLRAGKITPLPGRAGSPILAFLYDLRGQGVDLINRSLAEPAAALANGMLLGVESGIPADLYDAFKSTGTAHVIVISGSNIALFSGYLIALLARLLGRRRAVLPAVAAVAVYVALAGGDVSAVRAGIMAGIYLCAALFGRQSLPLLSLSAAALVMTAANPRALFDVGFQLSALATLGLILFTPGLQRRFDAFCKRRLPAAWATSGAHFIGEAVLITLAAQVMTLPLTAARFGRLSPVSLAANFLILPVQPAILIGGLALLLAGAMWPPAAAWLAPVPWLFLTYTVQVVRLAAALPFASVAVGKVGPGLLLIYYGGLVLAVAGARLARRGHPAFAARRLAAWGPALALPALILGVAGASYFADQGDGRLHVWYLTAGRGEAVVMVTPSGRRVLVSDGGGVTAAALERSRGVPGGREPLTVIGPASTGPGSSPEGLAIDPAMLVPGQTLQIDQGVTLTRVQAGESWALALKYGDFSTLLPVTLGQAAQAALLANGGLGPLTVLKVANPGTGAWPVPEFLVAAAPQLILWPQETTYPPATAAQLTAQAAARTEAGALIEVVTDGRSYSWRQWGADAGN